MKFIYSCAAALLLPTVRSSFMTTKLGNTPSALGGQVVVPAFYPTDAFATSNSLNFTVYPYIQDICDGSGIDWDLYDTLKAQAPSRPMFLMIDFLCGGQNYVGHKSGDTDAHGNPGPQGIYAPLYNYAWNTTLFGGYAYAEATQYAGYWFKREGVLPELVDPTLSARAWMMSQGDAITWQDYGDTHIGQAAMITILSTDVNVWLTYTYLNPTSAIIVDIFGIVALCAGFWGIYNLATYHRFMYNERNNKAIKKDTYNFMYSILCLEVFINFYRAIGAFGSGMSIVLGRQIGWFWLLSCMGLPPFMLFGNAICTINCWVGMTSMVQRSADETAKRQWLLHTGVITAIVFMDMLRVLTTLFSTGSLGTIVNFSIFLIYIIMAWSGMYIFLRGVTIVVNKMGSTSKATKKTADPKTGEAPKASAIDLFLAKVSRLAYFMGANLVIGVLMLMYYALLGGNNNYLIYNWVIVIPYFFMMISDLGQMSFAMNIVMKKVNDAKEKARKTSSGGSSTSTFANGLTALTSTFRGKGASAKSTGGSGSASVMSSQSAISTLSTKSTVDDNKSSTVDKN